MEWERIKINSPDVPAWRMIAENHCIALLWQAGRPGKDGRGLFCWRVTNSGGSELARGVESFEADARGAAERALAE